jgi:hypothetical protein
MPSLSLTNNLSHVSDEFLDNFPADVTFLIGPERVEVKGHKATLATASNVMCNTLKSQSQEAVFAYPSLNVEGFKLMMVVSIFKK